MSRAPRARRGANPNPHTARPARTVIGRDASRRWLAVLLVSVLCLKVAIALTLTPHPLLQPEGELDAGEYWRLAQRVVSGDVLLQSTPFYVSPLYIYWLAFAMTVAGGGVAGVLVLQAVLGTTAVWVIGRAAACWGEPGMRLRAAIVAGGALALTGVVALQEALILQSALDPLLMALFALACTRALVVPSAWRWTACGAALALLATNRPNAWLLAIICLPAAWCTATALAARGRALGACVLGAVVVVLPFTVRTAVATGQWQVLPGHGGLNLHIGNHPAANGTYTVIDGIRPSIEGQRSDAQVVASRAEGRHVPPSQVSAHFVRRSVEWWRTAPLDALRLFTYKAWLSTHAWELPVNVSYAWFREQIWLLRMLPVGAWLLVPLGLATSVGGHLVVARQHRAGWRWFRWLLPAYLFSVALFFVVDRYRAPGLVLAALHLGVLSAMPRVSAEQHEGRGAFAAAAVALVVFIGGLVPLPFQLGEGEADTQMALHAIVAGRDEDADRWLEQARARHPAPGVAWFRAGLGWQSRGDLGRAERALREAHRLDPEVSDVTFALAGVLLSQGKGAEALPLLQQLERAGDDGAPAHAERLRLDLALAYWQAGDEASARGVLASGVPPNALPLLRARALAAVDAGRDDLAEWLLSVHREHVPHDAEVVEKLALTKAQQGQEAEAASLFEEAIRLEPGRATARFNLAVLRARQGRREEAIALLREALRIDPTYAQAAGALRELLQ